MQRALESDMRLRTIFKLVALGLGVRAIVRISRDRRGRSAGRADPFAADPGDPVQSFDEAFELQGTPLDVDALSSEDALAAQDLAGLESDIDELSLDDDAIIELVDVDVSPSPRDAGDLYGAHTPVAVDRAHPDDDVAFINGQSWLEALETSAIENGADREYPLDDIVDDQDVLRPPHRSSRRDTPVADHGSGGRRGL